MQIFGISDLEMHDKTIGFWSDVYGFKMNCFKKLVIEDSQLLVIKPDTVVTDLCTFKPINCCECTTGEISDFESDFTLKVEKDCLLTGLGSSFDTFFNSQKLKFKSSFSTSPFHEPTHWQQTVFQLEEPVNVKKGSTIKGNISCFKNPNYQRSYIVIVNIFNKQYRYKVE
jgi:type I protein arginine methyltransferase